MKMTKKHYEVLEKAIKPLDTPERRESYKKANLTSMRYRWDLFWKSEISKTCWMQEVYNYCNDDHIDTVLRKIVPDLGGGIVLSYEIWIEATDGSSAPYASGIRTMRKGWSDKEAAIELAKAKHSLYPGFKFLVKERQGHQGPYVKVYDTSEESGK